ncbi:DNA-binding transcriptional LysR family regulator [Catenuloplanes nepalensis]|uniref:DNA-binding transcriptional LysR family regulator n=1 Tax=Catenuloplanes nepalensis TaxID=587533 RepID=A0ABT9MNL9_9ACTN|nr:LysR family transcriptional regulator [Catenuloplanes nepalensis]MDP9792999.1 DNA-binding transcriptional LysR family regulator [Catenuloplanes nepalensis]
MNLASLDLNLLISLDALLRERSVTRAATRLALSQPALSASLSRLRRHFGDDLLTRVGNTYELTPLAIHLKELTAVALAGVERVFARQPDFDPAVADREFTILTSDYGLAVAGAELAAVLGDEAPGIRLRLHHITTGAVDRAAETLRTVDGLLLPHGFLTDLPHLDLYTDRWVCVVAADHPGVRDTLTMADLAALPWVLTFHEPTAFTPAARQLRLLGVEPKARIVVQSFLAVPFVLAGTNRVALMQEHLARRLSTGGGLRVLDCPFEPVPLVEALWWHPMYDRDPEHMWLRDRMAEVGRRIGQ